MTTAIGISGREWDHNLASLPPEIADVYFSAGYHHLHELNGAGQAWFCATSDGPNQLLICGLRQEIPDAPGLSDFETCNGYGGPVTSADAEGGFLAGAWEDWKKESRQQGVVAGFFRLHPLLRNEACLPHDAKIRFDRQTVFVDLSRGIKAVWDEASSQHRNMVSKAKRDGALIRWNDDEDWCDFVTLYSDAMTRLRAPLRLAFPPLFFTALRAMPGVEWVGIRRGSALDAVAVFMHGAIWTHYHLAARASSAPNYAMSCLLQAGFERAAAAGKRGVHLGGGKTAAPDDGLFRFKLSTGGDRLDFKVALVVADPGVYRQLCDDWSRRAGTSATWLLGYRQPQPVHHDH